MATTNKSLYGTNNQAITITLASLGIGAAQSSAAIDNTSNLFLDVLVSVKIKTNAAGTASTGFVSIYAYGTTDGGTTYGGGESGMGTNASVTLPSPPNIRLIGVITANSNGASFANSGMSVAAAFGGMLPDHWGIVAVNSTGAALDSTAGNFTADYQGVQTQAV